MAKGNAPQIEGLNLGEYFAVKHEDFSRYKQALERHTVENVLAVLMDIGDPGKTYPVCYIVDEVKRRLG